MEIRSNSSSGMARVTLNQYKRTSLLAQIKIFYNQLEGMVSVFFGIADETLSLFGFGIDSFVEVLSGMGIWNMVRRMMHNPEADVGSFEKEHFESQAPCFIY